MGIISLLMLVAVPVSLVFAIVFLIQTLKQGRDGGKASSKQDSKFKLIISAAICVACLAVLIFTGKFYSLYMTMQMPPISGIQSAWGMNPDSNAMRLNTSEDIELTGTKAVTFNENFGASINTGQDVFFIVDNFPSAHLFRYSDQYIPGECRAAGASEVGFIVFIKHSAIHTGAEYTNNAKAFRHVIEVRICDDKNILAEKTFTGNLESETTGSDTLGPAPDKEVSEWVAGQLAKFSSEKPAVANEADAKDTASNAESNEGALTAAQYSADFERAAGEKGIELTPNPQNRGTFFVFYLGDSITGDESVQIEDQAAGLRVTAGIHTDSLLDADTVDLYSLVLRTAGVTGSEAALIVEDIQTIFMGQPDGGNINTGLEYPGVEILVDVASGSRKGYVHFTFVE